MIIHTTHFHLNFQHLSIWMTVSLMLQLLIRLSFTNEMWVEVIGTTSQQKLSHLVFQSSFLSLCHFVQLKALNGHHQVNSEISAGVMVMIVIRS